MEEDFLTSSGLEPLGEVTQSILSEDVLNNATTSEMDFTTTADGNWTLFDDNSTSLVDNITMLLDDILFEPNTTTNMAPVLPFDYNKWKIGFLAARTVMALLLLILTAAIRRDFFKTFLFILLIPILADVGFDIYSEIEAGMNTLLGTRQLNWVYYLGNYNEVVLHQYHSKQIQIYTDMLVHYTSYNFFKELPFYAMVSFIINDFLFWSLLLSTIMVFYFAHKAITQPEDINYIPTLWPFVKLQLIPILLTALDALINLFQMPSYVFIGVSAILRMFTVIVALIIVFLFLASFFKYCRRPDEYALGSPYAMIRFAKSRLFWFQVFVLLVHTLSAPYIAWCAISIAQDFITLFNLGHLDPVAIYRTSDAFVLHINTFLLRGIVVCVLSILVLPPFRKKFVRIFFPCCCRKY